MGLKRTWEFMSAGVLLVVVTTLAGAWLYRRTLNDALVEAIRREDTRCVRSLLRKGAWTRERVFDSTPLMYAVRWRDEPIVRMLLERGADPNERGAAGGETALMMAAEEGQLDMVRLLLEYGADPNARVVIGRTALMMAAEKGHSDVVQLLAAQGADTEVRDRFGLTARDFAGRHKSARHKVTAQLIDRLRPTSRRRSLPRQTDRAR